MRTSWGKVQIGQNPPRRNVLTLMVRNISRSSQCHIYKSTHSTKHRTPIHPTIFFHCLTPNIAIPNSKLCIQSAEECKSSPFGSDLVSTIFQRKYRCARRITCTYRAHFSETPTFCGLRQQWPACSSLTTGFFHEARWLWHLWTLTVATFAVHAWNKTVGI